MADSGDKSRTSAPTKSSPTVRSASAASDIDASAPVRQLQRSLGNAGMQTLLGLRTSSRRDADLRIGSATSPIERDADRMAGEAMRKSIDDIDARSSIVEPIQAARSPMHSLPIVRPRRERMVDPDARAAPPVVHRALNAQGRPLDPSIRGEMESRFGVDFGGVRVHSDGLAADSARAIGARAYTHGGDIVFGAGMYRPGSMPGKTLLAHELAHVSQLPISGSEQVIHRQRLPGGVPYTEDMPSSSSSSTACRCEPFSSAEQARRDRDERWPSMRVDIVDFAGEEVARIYDIFVSGGSPSERELSGALAREFAESSTSLDAAHYLTEALLRSLRVNPIELAYGRSSRRHVLMSDRVDYEIHELQDRRSAHRMNFSRIASAPGTLAGDIGDTDFRTAEVTADISRINANEIQVQPRIAFTVRDVVDFCPGDCGDDFEREYTIPMSRWEASGVAGDVPFRVTYTVDPDAFTAPYVAQPITREYAISGIVQRYSYVARQLRRPEYDVEEVEALTREIGNIVRTYTDAVMTERGLDRAAALQVIREEILDDGLLNLVQVNAIMGFAE